MKIPLSCIVERVSCACRLLGHATLGCLIAACGPEHLTAEASCGVTESAGRESVFEHACEHARVGPFGTLDGGRKDAELRNTHMYYAVSLRRESDGFAGQIAFVARTTARHGFFLSADAPLRLSSAQEELCPVAMVGVGDACASLARVQSYDLYEGQRLDVTLGPWSQPTVSLVVELQ